ncbi:MAG: alpha-L-rhamnosidase C-terminal domain-containing protein [Mangrovibacterium sp.]
MKPFYSLVVLLGIFLQLSAQLPPVLSELPANSVQKDELTRYYLAPQRVVWQSAESEEKIRNLGVLLNPGTGQAAFGLKKEAFATLTNAAGDTTGFILDFGKEIQGGIQMTTCTSNRVTHRIRVRFGESVAETCSKVVGDGTTGLAGGATNHHAMRDFVTELPGYGTKEFGESGFRFVRIDLLDYETSLNLLEVRAYATFRDIPYLGSFECSDPRLNGIWKTGAYTVHVNMQEYLWDGIKRDRMVWLGDMHPEVMTISAVFGANPVVPKSLDFVRDQTPLPRWMNGISAYSMWWVNIQCDWYLHHGNLDYLRGQQTYLSGLLDLFLTKVDSLGRENLHGEGMRFLDWPSSTNEQGVHAGLQALMVMTFTRGAELCRVLGDPSRAEACEKMVDRMKTYLPDPNHSKQAAALLALANLMPAEKANAEVIAVDGAKNFSTFYGYYMLQAQAKAGDYQTAIDNIRSFWGAMLDLGATTFWEDFNLDWTVNAARIDEMIPEGKVDIHAAYGDYCYIGYRHSLCHGWASGPTAWLSEHVLGIRVLEPGCRAVRIEPHLADLQWAKGTFPTPFGLITVSHTKLPDGSIKTEWDAPKEVNIIQ